MHRIANSGQEVKIEEIVAFSLNKRPVRRNGRAERVDKVTRPSAVNDLIAADYKCFLQTDRYRLGYRRVYRRGVNPR